MKRLLASTGLALALMAGLPAPAAADVTAFLGFSPTPETRTTRGFAVAVNVLVVGFEFEFARTAEKPVETAPALTTSMFNAQVTTPTSAVQIYASAGGGFYRERFGSDAETGFGTNVGGGAKLRLAGPIRLRLDVRLFDLRGGAVHKNPKRFYAGVSVGF
jgi:hypothetical protein